MLDQTFTPENFRRIFDQENRKGIDITKRFFPRIELLTLGVREAVREIRELRSRRSQLVAEDFDLQLIALKDALRLKKEEKSNAIEEEMESLNKRVLDSGFKISLESKIGPFDKPVYCIDGSPETFFVVKQLQRNLNRLYGIKQANRHELVSQLRDALISKFPFEIVRTDISSFFESINRKQLLQKLDEDQLLSPPSRKFVKQILDSYASLSGCSMGIPRGVGISSYLAELVLRPLDWRIREIPGNILYCRYVDDIVAIFARPPVGPHLPPYSELILKIIEDNGLLRNERKTYEFDLAKLGVKKFEYLGYRFSI